ncbi:hypothetical protein M422DRAFT_51071 [Sphaerobolus stellatus SS14]|uniref:T6SS Phospholipase effector Tle1-like catalytic domain-containing protein n=1 Tax=Sphaerobolus stellatus (strain SS14) TaxID=990650 RepID=A0A0C9VGK8_SPHS4|nr:hypothetical protein M422DRAFT_51071 [Sphaerobolus stellatus SS14]
MVASKSSQQSQSQFTPPRPKDAGFRTLILLFDGTGDKLRLTFEFSLLREDEDVTNVIRLRNMLYGWNNKESKEQLVYYRPGIGTYHPRFWEKDLHIPVVSSVSRTYDQATAWSLGYHIVGKSLTGIPKLISSDSGNRWLYVAGEQLYVYRENRTDGSTNDI